MHACPKFRNLLSQSFPTKTAEVASITATYLDITGVSHLHHHGDQRALVSLEIAAQDANTSKAATAYLEITNSKQ